jgi:hypothetical protein
VAVDAAPFRRWLRKAQAAPGRGGSQEHVLLVLVLSPSFLDPSRSAFKLTDAEKWSLRGFHQNGEMISPK